MRSTDPIQIHISIQCPHTLHGVSATAKNIVSSIPKRFLLLFRVIVIVRKSILSVNDI